MPFTWEGISIPAASNIVGTMSMTWWNWVRSPPASPMPFGQEIASALRVPPKWDATCFVHWNGASRAHAQPTLKWFSQRAVPKSSMCSSSHSGSSCTPFWNDGALHAPWIVPSADAPLSPVR